jgi:hypothetical protein
VATSCNNFHGIVHTNNLSWDHSRGDKRAVTQATVTVVPPASNGSTSQHAAGVVTTNCHSNAASHAAD